MAKDEYREVKTYTQWGILAGFLGLVQSVIWIIISLIFIGMYGFVDLKYISCDGSFTRTFYESYMKRSETGSYLVFVFMVIYLTLSLFWLAASIYIVISIRCKQSLPHPHLKHTKYAHIAWAVITLLVCVLDLVFTILVATEVIVVTSHAHMHQSDLSDQFGNSYAKKEQNVHSVWQNRNSWRVAIVKRQISMESNIIPETVLGITKSRWSKWPFLRPNIQKSKYNPVMFPTSSLIPETYESPAVTATPFIQQLDLETPTTVTAAHMFKIIRTDKPLPMIRTYPSVQRIPTIYSILYRGNSELAENLNQRTPTKRAKTSVMLVMLLLTTRLCVIWLVNLILGIVLFATSSADSQLYGAKRNRQPLSRVDTFNSHKRPQQVKSDNTVSRSDRPTRSGASVHSTLNSKVKNDKHCAFCIPTEPPDPPDLTLDKLKDLCHKWSSDGCFQTSQRFNYPLDEESMSSQDVTPYCKN